MATHTSPTAQDNAFVRYLAAKKRIDDRALNRHVWQAMAAALPPPPLRVLEVGAGIGTMAERLVERGVLTQGHYTAVDADPHNSETAARRLPQALPPTIDVELVTADIFDFIAAENGRRHWDLLIAHAFLDLVDAPRALPLLFSLLRPRGHYYFTLNFDGATIFEPTIDPALDAQIEALYHRSMDERTVDGRPSGDSRSGRHLFHHLRRSGAHLLAAGSSDWVVHAGADGYAAGEAYFLHFIIDTIDAELRGHPKLDATAFAAWVAQRHAQIEAGELVYIAHQLDFFGRVP